MVFSKQDVHHKEQKKKMQWLSSVFCRGERGMKGTQDCCSKLVSRVNSPLGKCGVQKILLSVLPFLLQSPSEAVLLNSLFRKAWAGRNSCSDSPLLVMFCIINVQVGCLNHDVAFYCSLSLPLLYLFGFS